MISASCGNGSSERLCGRGSQKPIWSRQTHRTDISNQYLLDIDCPLLRSKGGAVIVQPRRKLCYSIARPRREVTRLAQHECRRILYRLLPIRPWTLSPPRTGRTARRLGSALKFLLSVRFFGQGAPTIPPEVARREVANSLPTGWMPFDHSGKYSTRIHELGLGFTYRF
jgi:hypothetical protein